MSFASEAARNQYKSDIFFSSGNTGIQPVSRPARENLKSNVFSNESFAAGTPSGAKHTKDHFRSDIFNPSGAIETYNRHTISSNATKTNIVFGDAEPVIVKKDKTKVVHNPDPYFKHETAFSRKLKEFYPGEDEKFKDLKESVKIAHGTIEKENLKENEIRMKEFSNPNLTARERRIIANSNSLNQQGVKNLLANTQNKNDDKKVFDKNATENKVKEMKSNIFYDPQREEFYQNFKPSKKQPKEEEEKKPEPVRPAKIQKSNWNSKLDWNDARNEILFHNGDNDKNYSAFERKIKNLQGNFSETKPNQDVENKFEPVPNPIGENRHEKNDRNTITDTLKEAVGNDEHRLKKNMELSAVHQGSDFYKNNAKFMKNIDRPVKSYEIKDIKNFENLKVDEIESIFRKKGIHIYDVKPSGSLIGSTSGDLTFKVRETDDDTKFSKNFEDVRKKLENDLKLNVEPTKVKDKKKMTDTLPADLKWDTPGLSNFGEKKADKPKVENEAKKEKFSKNYVPHNTSFKNFHGLHGFSKR